MDSDLSEFYDEFCEDSLIHLGVIKALVDESNDEGLSEDKIDALFSEIHTIKNASSTINLDFISQFLQYLEDLNPLVKEKGIDETLKAILLAAVSALEETLTAIKAGEAKPSDSLITVGQQLAEQLGVDIELGSSVDKEDASEPEEHVESPESEADNVNRFAIVDDNFKINFKNNELVIESDEADDETAKGGSSIVSTYHRASDELADDRQQSELESKKSLPLVDDDNLIVSLSQIDELIQQFGEVIVSKSQLAKTIETDSTNLDLLFEQSLLQLEQNILALRKSLLSLNQVPLNDIFSPLTDHVYAEAEKHNKSLEFNMDLSDVTIDKRTAVSLLEPLKRLINNAIEHGIEDSAERERQKKEPRATLSLNAYLSKGYVVIELYDDGKGFSKNKASRFEEDLLEQIAERHEQGGLLIVRNALQALGGSVEVDPRIENGTLVRCRIPVSRTIIDGQLIQIEHHRFVLPEMTINEVVPLETSKLKYIAGERNPVHRFHNSYIPILCLNDFFDGRDNGTRELTDGLLIVVETRNKKIGLYVNEMLEKQQVVLKPLETHYRKIKGILGATVLGDGNVSLVIDIDGLLDLSTAFYERHHKSKDKLTM